MTGLRESATPPVVAGSIAIAAVVEMKSENCL
jgi:hypothetical protein